MPVHSSANCTDIHLLTLLNLSPTKFAMCNELLVFLDFLLNRKLLESYDPAVFALDIEDFLAAVGTIGVLTPPALDTLKAEDMSAREFTFLREVVVKANDAPAFSAFRTAFGFRHPSGYPRLRHLARLLFASYIRQLSLLVVREPVVGVLTFWGHFLIWCEYFIIAGFRQSIAYKA